MNAELIMQIVEESKTIPDDKWGFPGCSYQYMKSDEKEEISPIWQHVLKHPELVKRLKVTSDSVRLPQGRTHKTGSVDESCLMEYLNLSLLELRYLFSRYEYSKHRQCFINTVTSFVNGEIEVRVCRVEECEEAYTTWPDDKASVCSDCKDDLMEMCGL